MVSNPNRLATFLVLVCLLCVSGCSPSTGSAFLTGLNPSATLNQIGSKAGISYQDEGGGTSSSYGLISGLRMDKNWIFTFQGSHDQLLNQLDRFRGEIERQLSTNRASVSGRGKWEGNFSGFRFDYASGAVSGFIRVTGVSLESGKQGVEIIVYER